MNAKFFELVIDESIDITITSHLFLFATFVEDCLPIPIFLDILCIFDGFKNVELI